MILKMEKVFRAEKGITYEPLHITEKSVQMENSDSEGGLVDYDR